MLRRPARSAARMSQTRDWIITQVLAHHLLLHVYLQLNTSILHSKHTELGNRTTPALQKMSSFFITPTAQLNHLSAKDGQKRKTSHPRLSILFSYLRMKPYSSLSVILISLDVHTRALVLMPLFVIFQVMNWILHAFYLALYLQILHAVSTSPGISPTHHSEHGYFLIAIHTVVNINDKNHQTYVA